VIVPIKKDLRSFVNDYHKLSSLWYLMLLTLNIIMCGMDDSKEYIINKIEGWCLLRLSKCPYPVLRLIRVIDKTALIIDR
jgi:hypothetical protein